MQHLRTVMADRCTLAILSVVLIVAGCTTTLSEHPQFRSCMNQCTSDYNACVSEATEADQLESCSTEIRSCAAGCEKDHGLYIEGAIGIDRANDAPSLAEAAVR